MSSEMYILTILVLKKSNHWLMRCKRSLQIQKKNFQHLLNFYKATDLLGYKMHPEQKKSYQAMTPEKKLQVALDLYYSA